MLPIALTGLDCVCRNRDSGGGNSSEAVACECFDNRSVDLVCRGSLRVSEASRCLTSCGETLDDV